jgi:ABC-2 type transport system permease protein
MKNFSFIAYSLKNGIQETIKSKRVFWLKIVASIIKHLFFIVAWNPFYTIFHNIQGWEFGHFLLLTGLLTIGTGIVEFFFDGLREIPRIIDSGYLDTYLLYPKNVILTIALSKSTLTSLSDILTGLLLIALSGKFEPIVLIFMVLSPLFFFSLYLYIGSIRFFIPNSSSLIYDVYSKALLIASQPNISYSGILKLITLTILPVSLISLFPIEYLIHKNKPILLLTITLNFSFLFFSILIFKLGLKKYESISLNHYR